MRRLWLVSVLAVLALSAALLASVAQARLDPSFGRNGVVSVRPPLTPPWQSLSISQLAAGRDGSSYALFVGYPCKVGFPECTFGSVLFRYADDGTLDGAFAGSGSYTVPDEADDHLGHVQTLAVDSAGRPLIVQVAGSRISVRRLTRSGAVDAGFGDGGVASFECGCARDRAHLFPGPRGSVIVFFSHLVFHGADGRARTIGTLVRLRADGSLDTSFGQAGTTVVRVAGGEGLVVSAVSPKGAVYLTRAESSPSMAVVRVSADGVLDRRFIGTTRRALRPIRQRSTLAWSVSTVLLRSNGQMDLLGGIDFEHGFILRLNRNGQPVRGFGKRGLRTLRLQIDAAARGSDGAAIGVSEDIASGRNSVMRMLGDGKLDRAFGVRQIPDSFANVGFSVVSQTRGRALVLDLGYFECREACAPKPKLIRYLEGPARTRR